MLYIQDSLYVTGLKVKRSISLKIGQQGYALKPGEVSHLITISPACLRPISPQWQEIS